MMLPSPFTTTIYKAFAFRVNSSSRDMMHTCLTGVFWKPASSMQLCRWRQKLCSDALSSDNTVMLSTGDGTATASQYARFAKIEKSKFC
jgi:hypothetical protein